MLSIELRGVEETRRKLQDVPPSLRGNLRRRITGVAGELVSEMRSTAAVATNSTRIPRSIKVETKFSVRTTGVRIRSSGRIAPHNVINEHGGRHPVFTYAVWTYQRPRPFFYPTARRKTTRIRGEVQAAINDTAREF